MKNRYSLTIPLIPGKETDFDFYLDACLRTGARRVFLFAPLDNICRTPVEARKSVGSEETLKPFPHQESCDTPSLELYEIWAELYERRRRMFEEHGIEADFWIGETIGHGGGIAAAGSPFTPIVGPNGQEASGSSCPLDPEFLSYMEAVFTILARKRPGLILLDDDFRLHYHNSQSPTGCFCDRHIAVFNERYGKTLTREEIAAAVYAEEPNEIRSLWYDVTGDSLLHTAQVIEKAVHRISPDTRIGLAAAMTHWSSEGVDMAELLRAFAGSTRPFIRTYGSPYRNERSLSHIGRITEFSQAQRAWLSRKLPEAEIVAEGDTYPHTRYCCPVQLMHSYELGLYCLDFPEVLRYPFPFSAPAAHETGYIDKAEEQRERYAKLRELFDGSVEYSGITPLWVPNCIRTEPVETDVPLVRQTWPDEPGAVYFLSKMGIPLAHFSEDTPVFAAGPFISALSDAEIEGLMDRGLILDAPAAKLLNRRGFEIGVQIIGTTDEPAFERYTDELCGSHQDETIWLLSAGSRLFYQAEVAENARVLSSFTGKNPGWSLPAAVLYENSKGQRVMTYCFDLLKGFPGRQLLHNYARQEQLANAAGWVAGRPLAVSVNGMPNTHVICRTKGEKLLVAVHNTHLDPAERVTLRLDGTLAASVGEVLVADRLSAEPRPAVCTWAGEGVYASLTVETDLPAMELSVIILKRKQEEALYEKELG